jgi:hypothetical protein
MDIDTSLQGTSQPSAPDGAHTGAPEGQSSPPVPADAGGQSSDELGQSQEQQRPEPSVQDRINELTRHRRVAERVAAEAIEAANRQQQEAAQMRAYIEGLQRAGMQPQGGEGQQQHDGPPDPSQYNDWGTYTRAVAQYEARQLMQRSAEEQRQAAMQQQQVRAQQMAQHAHRVREATLNAAAEAGQEKYPDFVKVLTNPALPSIRSAHPSVVDALAYSDVSADLMYYFGKNPAEAHRVIGLHPTLAIRELGKLEAKLAAGTVQLSSAAPPVDRVRGGSNAPDPLSDRSSIESWMKARTKQVSGRR